VIEPFPSPLDGLVHQMTEVTTGRGARLITVKCGAKMPTYRSHERLAGACGFPSKVTCPECQPTPAGVVQAAFEKMVAENYANRPAVKAAKKKESNP